MRPTSSILPAASLIIGADSIGDTLVLFTTAGVWTVSNASLDPVDDFGNIEWSQQQISKDAVLWGDPGIAGWNGALIVPAVDDVFLFTLDGVARPLSQSIRPLYRSYVKAGYQPGTATVHRGHYWLPIVNGTALVDTLVCRLDAGFAWTRWSGHAAGGAYAQRVGSTTRSPKLLGIDGQRVTDLTGTLVPSSSNAQDADGANFDFTITTRDYETSQGSQPGFVQRARAVYELTDDSNGATAAPTVAIAFSSDQDAGAWTNLSDKGQQGGGAGWGTSAGDKYQWANVGRRRQRIRFRLTFSGASASAILRSFKTLTRPQGRQ